MGVERLDDEIFLPRCERVLGLADRAVTRPRPEVLLGSVEPSDLRGEASSRHGVHAPARLHKVPGQLDLTFFFGGPAGRLTCFGDGVATCCAEGYGPGEEADEVVHLGR